MARLAQLTQEIDRVGLVPAMTAPTVDGDIVDCGNVAIMVDNASGGSINVTVEATATLDGLDVEDLVVPVAAGTVALIGPLPQRTFGQLSGANKGSAFVNYSAQASVTRAIISF